MKISATLDYAATPHEVFAMLADVAFQTRKCEATGALNHTVSISAQGDRTVIVSSRDLPTDDFPAFVKGLVGDTLAITETQDWGPPGTDGTRRGTLTVDIAGAPIELNGTLSLKPGGQGSVGGALEGASRTTAVDVALRMAGHPGEGRVAAPSDQQPRPLHPGVPELAQLVQLLLQPPPARTESCAGRLEVVPPRPDADTQREPALGESLDGRRLARDQGRRAERGDQDEGGKPDPLGHRSGGIEHAEALEPVPRQPVVDAERAERGGVRVAGPTENQVGRRAGNDARQTYA